MPSYDVPTYGHELPDDPKGKFEAKEIRHFVLVVDPVQSGQAYQLKYSLNVIDVDPATDPTRIDDYVTTTKPLRGDPAPFIETPWDVPVNGQQCYVVLDLDPNWENWQFIGLGMTTKRPNDGKDFGLYWVTEKPGSNPWAGEVFSGPIHKDGCKRIYFGVARRKKKETGCNMNFFTGFLHADDKIMPVIYDPDVRNQGTGLPPPGSGGSLIVSRAKGEDVPA